MRKQYRMPIILLALCALLGAGYLLLRAGMGSAQRGTLFQLGKNEAIESIVIINNYGSFSFAQDQAQGRWLVADSSGEYRANENKMELLLNSLRNFAVTRVLEEESPAYGFAAPQATVQFVTSEGKAYTFAVGGVGADAASTYVKDMLTETILLTDGASVAQLTGSLAAYRDKNVFTIDVGDVRRIEYRQNGAYITGCYRESANVWQMDHPYAAPARHIELNELVAAMLGWSVAGYPAPGATLGEMGLDNPAETITVTDGTGASQTIELGYTDGTVRYARVGGETDIVALYAVDVDLQTLTPDKLLYIAPLKCTIDEIKSIQIATGDVQAELTYDPATETATLGGRILAYDDFIAVFFKYISLVAAGRDEQSVPGEEIATLRTTYLDGTVKTLTLLSRDENTCFMRFAGEETVYYMQLARLNGLLERLLAISAQ